MQFLDDRFELNLMLVGDTDYIASLKQLAASHSNVNFLPPIGTKEIASFTNQFDVGIYSLPPTNFNNEHALPNKFFEYIQARLAIVIAPSPEMVRLVKQYELGVVAEDFSPRGMAHAIRGLTVEQIDQFKANASKHAYELSAEKNRELFMELIK
jgi:glycosyltransferase involved in cell wall biosynthesis